MKKYVTIAMVVLLLTGCDGENNSEAGDYLIEDVQIKFDNSHDQDDSSDRDGFQKQMVASLKNSLDDVYFSVTAKEIAWYMDGRKTSSKVQGGRVELNDVWYNIKPGRNHTITLVSDKTWACGFYSCEITSTLKKADTASPKLVELKQNFAQQVKAWQVQLDHEREEFKQIPMADFAGLLFSPSGGFDIKLPLKVEASLNRRESGIYLRRMNRLVIDKDDKHTLIYSFADPSLGIQGDLMVVNGKREDFSLVTWLSEERGVVFQSANGAVYYNQSGALESLYVQYDDVAKRYFIGLSHTKSLNDAATAFSFLRTMDWRYRGNNLISMADIILPQAELEKKYQAKVSELFDIVEIHQAIRQAVENNLEKPLRFVDPGSSMGRVAIKFSSQDFKRDIDIALFAKPVAELMSEAQREHPEGKQFGDILVYGDTGEEGYDYYRDAGNGLTLKFTVPNEVSNLAERILLISVLRQLDTTTLLKIPAEERKNLFKYSIKRYVPGEPTDRFFVINEGLIDSRGNLLIPNPTDGYFEFSEHQSFIVARKWQDHGDFSYSQTPDGFIFDERGKLLLHMPVFEDLIDNRLMVAGEGDNLGLYDLSRLRWLVKPTWDELQWQDGIFIANDLTPGKDKYARNVERQYLIDVEGKVLATGKRIDIIKDSDKLMVVGEKQQVSLINRQGRVLFNHPGSQLSYLPEIDGYAIMVSQPDSNERHLGIFSEQGEIILPPKYGDYDVQGDYLKMWAPDLRHCTFFDLRQVKDWRNHQPLQQVPEP
ncbi:hypothetical protein KGP17_06855 [Serratia sp. JSRIV001]|uniref:hypothetical protein n=1 Tax=Serratia sp. JSRIV001 TaxID=2831893 RepID=UPI001CBEE654|nr:hypothetical protein [Serratia sp. JSRIV001]UAN47248.1 hypothetical protein KGP17_06855 [Serratia sp. JSRIV001]